MFVYYILYYIYVNKKMARWLARTVLCWDCFVGIGVTSGLLAKTEGGIAAVATLPRKDRGCETSL